MRGDRLLQRPDLGFDGRLGFGHQLVRQGLLQLVAHRQVLAIDRRLDDGDQLLQFVLGEALIQDGPDRRRCQFDGALTHHGQHLVAVFFHVRLDVFHDRLALVRRDARLDDGAGSLHENGSGLLRQQVGHVFDRWLLQLQQLGNQFLLGRGGLGAGRGSQSHQHHCKRALQFHSRSFMVRCWQAINNAPSRGSPYYHPRSRRGRGSDPMTLRLKNTRFAAANTTRLREMPVARGIAGIADPRHRTRMGCE